MGARAVLWDIDGTLVLSEPFHFRALRGVTAEYGIELPDSFHEEMVGRTAEETFILICERYGLEESFARWVAKKYRRYVETAPQIPAREGALEAFHALREAHVPQALVSNSDRIVVEANIRAMGLLLPRLVSVDDQRRAQGEAGPGALPAGGASPGVGAGRLRGDRGQPDRGAGGGECGDAGAGLAGAGGAGVSGGGHGGRG